MRATARLLLPALLSGAILSAAGGADAAKVWKLTAGSSHPPIIPWVATIKNFVVPQSNVRLREIGSPETIKWTEAYAGALYNFKNTLEGIEQGLADIGWVGTLWEPVKLPLQNVSFYAPFASGDVMALTRIAERMNTTIPAMKQAWLKYNQVYLGPQVADTYNLITTFPVNSVDDLKGKKLMAPGAVANWLKGTGAVAVNGGLPVYYNNMKTGVADGGVVITTGMLPFKLHEVAKYVTVVDMGAPISGALTMNKDTWDSLPLHMKMMFRGLGRDYGRIQSGIVAAKARQFLKVMAKQGAIVSVMPAAERARWVKLMPDLARDWVKRNEAKGLPARQVLSAFMEGIREAGGKPARDWDKEL
jgi:TRAP-type C4-dicarboxylate transport system substrate-binding protein